MIKLFVSDLDGCISHPFIPPDWHAISEIKKLNESSESKLEIPALSLCTGRPYPYAEAVAQWLNVRYPILFESGIGCYHPKTNALLWSSIITPEIQEYFTELRKWTERVVLPQYPNTLIEFTKKIDVETNDTYLVNGYITHNKGGNSHTDETGPDAPTSLAWTNGTLTLSWSGDGTNNVYDVQIDNNSDFSSPIISETQWSEVTVVTTTDAGSFDIGTGTRYARVRQYGTNGLLSNYSSTLTFTVS